MHISSMMASAHTSYRHRRVKCAIERADQLAGTDRRNIATRADRPWATSIAADALLRAALLVAALTMAAPQPVSAIADRHRKTDSPRLIVADAALSLVERWKAELNVLRRRSPSSDAVTTLADCLQELVDAITAGHDMTVQLTIAEAHAVSHIPTSTLRWLCKHKADNVGARKREGVWYIDRSHFEQYLASPDGRSAVPEQATRSASAAAVEKLVALSADAHADLRLEP